MATTTVLQPRSVTAPQPFFTMGDAGNLFEVRAGVPLADALAQASCFLAAAYELVNQLAMEVGDNAAFSPDYLIEMSKAIVDSAVETLEKAVRKAA